MSKEFKTTCTRCSKPVTTEGGKIPYHTVGVVRGGKVEQVKCPGVGERPN